MSNSDFVDLRLEVVQFKENTHPIVQFDFVDLEASSGSYPTRRTLTMKFANYSEIHKSLAFHVKESYFRSITRETGFEQPDTVL